MTDTQHLFTTARAQLDSIASDVEKHFDALASHLREWIPSYDSNTSTFSLPPARPAPPPTTLERVTGWVDRNKALTAGIVAFVFTGSVGAWVYILQNNRQRGKRRARKSASGARTDVVVVAAASPSDPLASQLYLDLERRGFVVYVVVSGKEEERYVRAQGRADVLPLHLDLGDPAAAGEQVRRFRWLVGREHRVFEMAEAHRLRLCGLVLLPDTRQGQQDEGRRIEDTTSEAWSTALETRVLNTITLTRLFLPTLSDHPDAKILLLTPSVTPSLRMPGHSIPTTTHGALTSFLASLRSEVPAAIHTCHFKLGSLDIPAQTAKQRREGGSPKWKATPARQLNEVVFDALMTRRPARTWFVGRGSWAYDFVGRWAPEGVVGWMVGAGAARERERGQEMSRGGGEGSRSGSGEREEMVGSRGSLRGWEEVGTEG